MTDTDQTDLRSGRPAWVNIFALCLCGAVFFILLGLGNWQVKRLAWKNNLIETVNARIHQAPIPAPLGLQDASAIEYQRVDVTGIFSHDTIRKVKAITEIGPGHWLMTPLKTEAGYVWINRGFIPTGTKFEDWEMPESSVRIEGLLRCLLYTSDAADE